MFNQLKIAIFNKTLVWSGVSRILVAMLQLFYLKITSTMCAYDEIGIYYFIITVSGLFVAILFGPFDNVQQSKVFTLYKSDRSLIKLLHLNQKFMTCALVIIACIYFPFAEIYPEYTSYYYFAIVISFLTYIIQALRNILVTLNKKDVLNKSWIIESGAKVLIALWFYMSFLSANAVNLFEILLLSLFVSAAHLFYCCKKYQIFNHVNHIDSKIELKSLLKIVLPISFSSVVGLIQTQGYRFILIKYNFEATVGVFSLITSIGQSLQAAASSIFYQFQLPRLYADIEYIIKYLRNAIFLILIVCIGSFGINGSVLALITNPSYAQYSFLVPVGVLLDAGQLFIGTLITFNCMRNNTKEMIYISIVMASINIIILYFLIHFTNVSVQYLSAALLFPQMLIMLYVILKTKKWYRNLQRTKIDLQIK